jgi:hypothetical protein
VVVREFVAHVGARDGVVQTLVCNGCGSRWKVLNDGDGERYCTCPNCVCPHCTAGSWTDGNGMVRRCSFCQGTGRAAK